MVQTGKTIRQTVSTFIRKKIKRFRESKGLHDPEIELQKKDRKEEKAAKEKAKEERRKISNKKKFAPRREEKKVKKQTESEATSVVFYN